MLCSNIIKTLWIPQNIYSDLFIVHIDDPRPRIIVNYPKHPSILAIKGECKKQKPFLLFTCNTWGSFYKNKKTAQEIDIPTKIAKENTDIFANFVFQSFNNIFVTSIFPVALKLGNIPSVFGKASKNSKENYILPNVSKIYLFAWIYSSK